jgi:hypothetical protein
MELSAERLEQYATALEKQLRYLERIGPEGEHKRCYTSALAGGCSRCELCPNFVEPEVLPDGRVFDGRLAPHPCFHLAYRARPGDPPGLDGMTAFKIQTAYELGDLDFISTHRLYNAITRVVLTEMLATVRSWIRNIKERAS